MDNSNPLFPLSFQPFLTLLDNIFAAVVDVADTIADQPLLLLPVGVGFAGCAIALARRLMGSKRGRRR